GAYSSLLPPVSSSLSPDLRPPTAGLRPLPIAEILANQVLSLPIGPHMSSDAVATVVDAIKSFPEL
ncbi:MAG: DegT/DnrJ/EryC1/StrS family aminotransferase, partial [Verrucomicrobiota bacterium]